MELSDYLRVLRKRWILIIIFILAGLGCGASASILATPLYQASTLVFVSVQGTGGVNDLAQGNSFVQQQVKSYADAVNTPAVLNSVISQLNLKETPAKLALSVTATAPLDTVNIEIDVADSSPQRAADIANAVTSSFRQVIARINQPSNGGPSPISASVLRPATVPLTPTSPNTKLNLALGVLIGLVLGLGIAVLAEVLDTRIRTERNVREVTGAPIIGGIAFDRSAPKRPLIVQADPNSPRAEAFRSLRTNLQFLDVEGGPRSFVITSSVESEGKSTTAANLAIAMADSGVRIVIVDADLRRPQLAQYMGIEGAIGLTDVLIGRTTLSDALQQWGKGSFAVLPAGSVPPNPSELLGSQAMIRLLEALEKRFDAVIIDAPPLLPVTDGAVLSKHVRGALLVVAAGRTHRSELAAAISSLDNAGARVAGIILTMVPTRGPDAYGYGRYGYGRQSYAARAKRARGRIRRR